MSVHVLLLLFCLLPRFLAASEHVSVEHQLVQEGRRTGRLYCRVGIGLHLQIHPDGRVNGSHEPTRLSMGEQVQQLRSECERIGSWSVLELFAVSQGVIGIKGVYSNRFLAMNKRGRLHATESFTDDCKFRERFQENSYNTYASVIHKNHRTGREWFVALNKRGKAKMGSSPRVKAQHMSTHFLPRMNLHEKSEQGFTITDKEKDKQAPPQPLKPSIPKTTINSGKRNRQVVKYWPKFRFG